MTFANAAELVALLLRQSDRHPIRAVGAAELKLYDPAVVRSFRNQGILVKREDLRDDGAAVFHSVEDSLVAFDPVTGEFERYEDALDIQTFDIDITALCSTIREQSELVGPGPMAISTRVWRLGRHDRLGRSAEVCLVRRLREDTAQEIVDLVRGAIDNETSVALISLGNCDLPTAVARQLDRLCMTVASAVDLLREDPDRPFALVLDGMLVPTGPQRAEPDGGMRPLLDTLSSVPRLQISRGRRTLRFDGRDVVLSLVGFDAFVGAAEKVVAGDVILTYQELYALTNRSGHRDVLKEIRDQLEQHGIPRKDAFELVKTKHGRGVTIGLPPDDILIRD